MGIVTILQVHWIGLEITGVMGFIYFQLTYHLIVLRVVFLHRLVILMGFRN